MVVVFPTPFTPTTNITYGWESSGKVHSTESPLLFSVSNSVISPFRISFSSLVETYLSLATRSSIRWMILIVVSTPTSEETNISSRLSSTSSSTFDLPATARVSLVKTFCFVFSNPLSSVSFFFLLNKPNNPIRN